MAWARPAARSSDARTFTIEGVRDSLRFLLEVVGHPVETFTSAAEFLAAGPRDLACLILDHHMPQMTGLQLAERLHADGSSIPILLVTGLPSPALVARAAQLGIGCWRRCARFHQHPFKKPTALTGTLTGRIG